jgi:hypothetical protein
MTTPLDTQPDSAPLVPIEERTVEFYGDTITGALVQIGDVQANPFITFDGLGCSWPAAPAASTATRRQEHIMMSR